MKFKITGLDKLQRELADAQRALRSLDGTITTLKFDPDDPASVQGAIQQMEATIDSKTSMYRNNALVMEVAEGLKESHRKAILERKAEKKA